MKEFAGLVIAASKERTTTQLASIASTHLVLSHFDLSLRPDAIESLRTYHALRAARPEQMAFPVVKPWLEQHEAIIGLALREISKDFRTQSWLHSLAPTVPLTGKALNRALDKVNAIVANGLKTRFAEEMARRGIPANAASAIAENYAAHSGAFALSLAIAMKKAPHEF